MQIKVINTSKGILTLLILLRTILTLGYTLGNYLELLIKYLLLNKLSRLFTRNNL
jgi:hypothetical protein